MISIFTLGCPKNIVDSEKLSERLRACGLSVAWEKEPERSDIILINTCGFVDDAKRESIEEILRLSNLKKEGASLVVFGCLAKRYRDELKSELPEIDALFGLDSEDSIIEFCKRAIEKPLPKGRLLRDDNPPYSYIKISEGCNKRCSYCAIPSIRGRFRSFPPEEIISDAERKIKSGKRELVFVSQDLLSYNCRGYRLKDLLRDIASIDGDFWIRLLYLNPSSITDEFISFLTEEKKILRYLDIPFQHSEESILRLMRRPGSRKTYLNLIKRLRDAMPELAIRTTLIVGFPGESQSAFRGLLSFVEEAGFDRLGAFKYSKEEGTPASKLPGHIPERVKNERFDTLMRLQAEISLRKNQALIGRRFRALFDTPSEARIYSQAPEVDGITIVKGKKKAGMFHNLRVIGALEYDLFAEPL